MKPREFMTFGALFYLVLSDVAYSDKGLFSPK